MFAAGVSCGGVSRSGPAVGGESHFLHWCDGSCDEAGLECISGLCTRPCLEAEPNACTGLNAARCTATSIEPGAGAVCDVACASDLACASLGTDFHCNGGFCRLAATQLSSTEIVDASAGPTAPSELDPAPQLSSLELVDAGPGGSVWNGPQLAPSCTSCLQARSVAWGTAVAARLLLPQSELSSCEGYSHRIEPSLGYDGPLPSCSTPLECPSSDLAALNVLLHDPLFRQPEFVPRVGGDPEWYPPVLGLNTKGEPDGMLLVSFSLEQGNAGFYVGAPCEDPKLCVDIPPVVDALVRQLRLIDERELARPECAAQFAADAGN